MTPVPDFSIVIITRNEQDNVCRAVESALRARRLRAETEILLVDSASTDRTVELAAAYPISVLRLRETWFLTAAAGRYIGTLFSSGDFILFLDGDMELVDGWLPPALRYLSDHPQVAGVTGYVYDMLPQGGKRGIENQPPRDSGQRPDKVRHFGGAALYRRTALQAVGGFNPYLISEEEPELSIRLRNTGYQLFRLPLAISRHWRPPQRTVSGYARRARAKLYFGFGQALRYHWGTRLFWMYLWERGSFFAYLVAALITLGAFIAGLWRGQWNVMATWLLIVFAFLAVFLIRKRSPRRLFTSLVLHGLITAGAIRGFLLNPRPPSDYPVNAEVIALWDPQAGLAAHDATGVLPADSRLSGGPNAP